MSVLSICGTEHGKKRKNVHDCYGNQAHDWAIRGERRLYSKSELETVDIELDKRTVAKIRAF